MDLSDGSGELVALEAERCEIEGFWHELPDGSICVRVDLPNPRQWRLEIYITLQSCTLLRPVT